MIRIEDVRAYIHAHDDTHATRIEWGLCRPDGWLDLFGEGAWDYLCALYTPAVRSQILDRKVQRMSERYRAGHNQIVVNCAKPGNREVLNMGVGTHSADWHHVSMTPQNKRALNAWVTQEIGRQIKPLTINQSLSLLNGDSYAANNGRLAHDARRRIDCRLNALGTAIAYAIHERGPLPGDMPRALVTSLKLDCARHLFDLSFMAARQEAQQLTLGAA